MPKIMDKTWTLYSARPASLKVKIKNTSRTKISLSHGQMIYLFFDSGLNVTSESNAEETICESQTARVQEDEVDLELWKSSSESRDNKMASARQKSLKDTTPDPWDMDYLKSKGIKYMSFHAYMRKISSGWSRDKFSKLAHQRLSIDKNRSNQLSLKDMPGSITLAQQQFRHVDQIIFENSKIAENYINFWRNSNCQRIGFLYGTYEKIENTDDANTIPLGIRAKIQAIYEPPQKNSTNKVSLEDNAQISKVDSMAKILGLSRIGWILSDLLVEDGTNGTVKNIRNDKTHLLSAEETITAASFQLQHPNPCRMSEGHYGSKFVTIVCSGDEDNQVSFKGYQVTNQCMDLVSSRVIVPTVDSAALAYCRESDDDIMVPEVYYGKKDEYNNEVKTVGRPMPVEYLLTDMTVAGTKMEEFSWTDKEHYFPMTNRQSIGEHQNLASFCKHLQKYCGDGISQAMLQKKLF